MRCARRFRWTALAGTLAAAGSALAQGDFNGDGFADLAVGAPNEGTPVALNAGAVNIIYGRGPGFGLDAALPLPSQVLTQSMLGEVDEVGDLFGFCLAVGNFDGDPFDDLAIGVPNEGVAGIGAGVGKVIVLYGSAAGLLPATAWVIDQSALGAASDPDDLFGFSLAAGDFNCDGADDLAIGAPNEDFAGLVDAGAVSVAYGVVGAGLGAAGSQFLVQGSLAGATEAGDHFGVSLAAANFNAPCDCTDDLAVGADGEDQGVANEGAVTVVYGLPGLYLDPVASANHPAAQYWHQGNVGGGAEVDDHFGRALAAGDFDGNAAADLAVGIPDEDLGATADTGMVAVIYSTCNTGLQTAARAPQRWHQNSAGVPKANGAADNFGAALAAADFDGNGADDLAVGQPGEDIGGVALQTGGVTVLYGDPAAVPGGLVAPGAAPYLAQFWSQNDGPGCIAENNSLDDRQGESLAAGDFNADGFADLWVGVPLEDVGAGPVVDAGYAYTIYGSPVGTGGLWPCFLGGAHVASEGWRQSGGVPGAIEPGDRFGASAASNR